MAGPKKMVPSRGAKVNKATGFTVKKAAPAKVKAPTKAPAQRVAKKPITPAMKKAQQGAPSRPTPRASDRARQAVAKNPVAAARSRVTNPTKAPNKGGPDLGKMLDQMIPSRKASRTVSDAMKSRPNPLGQYNKGNPVADFLRNFIKIGK